MATWDEFVDAIITTPGTQKMEGDTYLVNLKLAEGECNALVSKGNTDGTWADIIALVGDVPDEKLNELLETAMKYTCGALVKLNNALCCVRCSVSIEHFSADYFVAVLLQTSIAAERLKLQFCAE
jgi:hypothetical protein